MGYLIFGILRVLIFLSLFVTALHILLPKAVAFYDLWKRSGKSTYLSMAATAIIVAFFFLSACFVMFMKVFINGRFTCFG